MRTSIQHQKVLIIDFQTELEFLNFQLDPPKKCEVEITSVRQDPRKGSYCTAIIRTSNDQLLKDRLAFIHGEMERAEQTKNDPQDLPF